MAWFNSLKNTLVSSFYCGTGYGCCSSKDAEKGDDEASTAVVYDTEPDHSRKDPTSDSGPSPSQRLTKQLIAQRSSSDKDLKIIVKKDAAKFDEAMDKMEKKLSQANAKVEAEKKVVDEILWKEMLDRGVCMDEFFDFYSVASRKISPMRMSEGLAGRSSLFPSGGSQSVSSTAAGGSSSSSDKESSTQFPTPRKTSKSSPRINSSEQEIITNWGVLTAVLVRARMLAFGDLAELTLRKHNIKALNVKGTRIMTSVQRRAAMAVAAAKKLAGKISKEADCLDSDWDEDNLLKRLFTTETVDTLLILANTARKLFAMQPMLVRVSAPCRIYGDIHGQLRDLLLLFHAFGTPEAEGDTNYVFNGDFVDRGSHQLEVIGLLFALKVLMPDRVFLVRGNHEDREMNAKYGFKEDCRTRLGKEFGLKAYDHIHKAFDQLPLGCIIGGKILCVHGGIGEGKWTFPDVEMLKRPLTGDMLYENNWIYNILWSDPLEEENNDSACKNTFGVHSSPRRQNVVQFGWNVTKMFCARNGISLIVRSHECKLGGEGFDVMHERRLIRVFSARDYEENGNSAAVLFISSAMAELPTGEQVPLMTVRPQVLKSATQAGVKPKPRPRRRSSIS